MAGNPKPNLPPVEHRFKPGQSGNPGGTAKGTRNRLQGKFLRALADDFDAHGESAIARARIKDPVGYIKVVASLMPKQVEQSHPLEDLTDGELTAAIALLRSRFSGDAGAGEGEARQPSQVN